MAELLLRLRHVPDDERQEILCLLDEYGIDYYETTAGSWGLGVAGLWLKEGIQAEQAHALLEAYHLRRQQEASLYPPASHWQHWQQYPGRSLLFLLLIAGVLGISLLPFFLH